VMVSLAIALGIFTKGTFIVWLSIFLIFFLIYQFIRNIKMATTILACIVMTVLLVNGFYMMRVAEYKKEYSGKVELGGLVNQHMNPVFLISNIVRSIGMHLALPSKEWNMNIIRQGVFDIHKLLGIKVNEPDITFGEYIFLPYFFLSEDEASNGFHFVLIILSIGMLLIFWRKMPVDLKVYLGVLLGSFIVFCLVIKWQPWISRFHLPWFVCACPWIACVWEKVEARKGVFILALMTAVLHLPWLLHNNMKPVIFSKAHIFNVSRFNQYFVKGMYLSAGAVEQSLSLLDQRGCYQLGLILGADTWEYPWWVGLKEKNSKISRIEHVYVQSTFDQYPYPLGSFSPCAIIKSPVGKTADRSIMVGGHQFIEKGRNEHVVLYQLP